MKYATLPIFCPVCESKVYVPVELLKRGVVTPATPEFLEWIRGA